MKLSGVTVYERGLSLLTFEHEIVTDGSTSQEIKLADIEGKLYGDKISVAYKGDLGPDFAVVNSTLQTTTVAGGSWLESGNELVKALYEEVAALAEEREIETQALKHYKDREELMWTMASNVFDPVTLAAKGTDVLGASADGIVPRAALIIDSVREFEAKSVREKLSTRTRLAEICERLEAAKANLQRETEGECCFSDGDEDALAKLNVAIRRPRTHKTRSLTVVLSSREAVAATLCVEYLVHSTSWRSCYDFRLSGTRLENCRVSSYVKISQKSGVDWRGVPIYVSSGDPLEPLAPAAPRKAFVDLAATPKADAHNHMMRLAAVPAAPPHMVRGMKLGSAEEPECFAMECRESFGNLRILLPEGTELTSRSAEHTVLLTDFTLKGSLYHHVATAHKKDAAYRAVVIENDSGFTILASDSNTVRLNDQRVGEVSIEKAVGTGSSFVLYAGIDDQVEVTDLGRKEFKSKTGSFITGPTVQREASGVQLEIKNAHPAGTPIELLVTYTLPESQNQQVNVAAKSEGAKSAAKTVTAQHDCLAHTFMTGTDVINQATGSYIQKFILPSGDRIKTNFSYTVAYPEGSKIKSWSENVAAA